MKTKRIYLTVIAAILFAAGSIALTGCGNASNNKSAEEHQHEATEAEHQHDMDGDHDMDKGHEMEEGHEHGDMAEAHYQCPMKCEGDKMYDKPGKCPKCNMDLKKVDMDMAHYQCPMKCEGDKTYDKEGNCPVCKMELKKVKSNH